MLYEWLRQLIIWLGLGELTWIGYWLLSPVGLSTGYVATATAWIVAMLAWMVLVIYLASGGVFLTHAR